MSKAAFKELEKALGFTYAPESILFDDFLRPKVTPPSFAVYDWMHVVFVGGIFNNHMGQFMWATRGTSFTYGHVHAYLKMWSWPHAAQTVTGVDVFSPTRAKASLEARLLKCTASEGRSILPVFAHLVRRTFIDNPNANPVFRPHAEAIGQLASIVEELEAAARGTANLARLQEHLDAHIGCYVRSPTHYNAIGVARARFSGPLPASAGRMGGGV